ncbi:MAG: hypothetical protein ACTHOU_02125, partial [Aureliella sp.]
MLSASFWLWPWQRCSLRPPKLAVITVVVAIAANRFAAQRLPAARQLRFAVHRLRPRFAARLLLRSAAQLRLLFAAKPLFAANRSTPATMVVAVAVTTVIIA